MLEQQQIYEEEPTQYAPTAYKNHAGALALTPHANALVAAYIVQVETEQQTATRARLEQLITAHLELDATPEQATRSAIQQLKDERLALEQQQATATQQAFQQRKRTRSAKQSARPATVTALKVFGPGALTLIGTIAAIAMLHDGLDSFSVFVTWLFFMYLGLPALLGTAVGMRVRHRPAMGTFCAVGILTPLVSLFAPLVLGNVWDGLNKPLQIATVMLLFWMPIGVASAGLTGWGRDTLRRKRRQQASIEN